MSVLGKYGGNALKYWGSILAAAYAGASNQDMWISIHANAAAYGLPSPQTQPPDVSVIRGYANRIVNASRALNTAAGTDAITPDMMAVAPYTASTAQDLAAAPTYHVRYLGTTQAADGTISTRDGFSVFTSADMPATVGGLQAAIDANHAEMVAQAAQQTGGASGGTSLGTSRLEITVV